MLIITQDKAALRLLAHFLRFDFSCIDVIAIRITKSYLRLRKPKYIEPYREFIREQGFLCGLYQDSQANISESWRWFEATNKESQGMHSEYALRFRQRTEAPAICYLGPCNFSPQREEDHTPGLTGKH